MSPLRHTTTSQRRAREGTTGDRTVGQRPAVNPIAVMLCALATLVAVPVLLSAGAGSDAVEVAAVAVDTSVAGGDETSASQLDAEIDLDALFDPGARVEDVPAAPTPEPDPSGAADAMAIAADGSAQAAGTDVAVAIADPQGATAGDGAESTEGVEAAPQRPASSATADDTSDAIAAVPATAPPETTAPTTAPPTTAAPATAAPTTAAPEPEVAAAAEAAPAAETQEAPVEQPAPTPGAPTAEQWAALRQCEASGSYTIVSSNGLYHGAYQFYQPTWDGLARQAGRTDLVGVAPSQAAPADQDALALLLWQQRGNQPWPHCGVHLPPGP